VVPETNLTLHRERTTAGESSKDSSIADVRGRRSTSGGRPAENAAIIIFAPAGRVLVSKAARLAEGVAGEFLKTAPAESELGRTLTTSRLPDGAIPKGRADSIPTMMVLPA
jgi:hypothetical protein